MSRKVCRECKMIVAEDVEECPNCGQKGQWNENFQGRARVFDPQKSVIAQKLGANVKGEFGIRSRS